MAQTIHARSFADNINNKHLPIVRQSANYMLKNFVAFTTELNLTQEERQKLL